MNFALKDLLNVMKDKDYYTLVVGLSMLTGFFYFDVSKFVCILLVVFTRILFLDNLNNKIEKAYNDVLQKIKEERNRPDFLNGSLSYILENYFPKISRRVREKVIQKLLENHQIKKDRLCVDDYRFYR